MRDYVMVCSCDLYLDEQKSLESEVKSLVLASIVDDPHYTTAHCVLFSNKQSFVKFKWIHLLWFENGIGRHDLYLCVIIVTNKIQKVRKRTTADDVLFHLISALFQQKKRISFFPGFSFIFRTKFQMSPFSIKSHLNRILIFHLFSMKIERVKQTSVHIFLPITKTYSS